MNSEYKTLSDIENYLKNNPWPSNFDELPKDKQELYLKKVEDIMMSIKLDGQIKLNDEFIKIIFDNMPNSNIFNEKVEMIILDSIVRIENEILDALKSGHDVTEELVELVNYCFYVGDSNEVISAKYEEIYSIIAERDKKQMKGYKGANYDYYLIMLDNQVPLNYIVVYCLRNNVSIDKIIELYEIALDKKCDSDDLIESLNYLNNNYPQIIFNICNMALNKGYTVNDLINCLGTSSAVQDEVIELFLKKDYSTVFKYLISGIPLSYHYIEIIMKKIIDNKDYDSEMTKDFLVNLKGKNYYIVDEFLDRIINSDNISFDSINAFYELQIITDEVYEKKFLDFIKKDYRIITKYLGTSNTNGLMPTELMEYLKKNESIINEDLVERVINGEFSYNKMIEKLQNEETPKEESNLIFEILGVYPIEPSYIRAYAGNKIKFIKSFDKIKRILNVLNINQDVFIQYAFGSSYDWLNDVIELFEKNEINDFINVKDYLFTNYFKQQENIPDVVLIKNIIDTFKNYSRYPLLCKNLLNSKLSEEDIQKLKILFDNPSTIHKENGESIDSKEDLKDIENYIFMEYQKNAKEALNSDSLDKTKNVICCLLFNMDYKTAVTKLAQYGNVKDFRQLMFNNRDNEEIIDDILEIMVFVSLIEDVIDCQDNESLKSILNKIIEDKEIYQMCQKCNILFRDYDEKMNELYAKEMEVNLTDLDNIPQELIDKEASSEYGVEVIDLSDRKYCLLEHVKSESEDFETLIKGRADPNRLFISLSLGSNRNQRLYKKGGRSIIFGTSKLPQNLFIRSSTINMGSNGYIKSNSYEVDTEGLTIEQRGAIETSSAPHELNSEILCYREGLDFQYIIVPGREPTTEEIEIAKQYNLKIVKVQELEKTIENPKDIRNPSIDFDNHQLSKDESKNMDELSNLHQLFQNKEKRNLRRIAVFTDAHGLFEPTLAILEDARRNGVDDIISLGDNIGTGPNPREVMDLLEVYGVKSIKGNHELYASGELEKLREHLEKKGAYSEALSNSTWTRSKLTPKQIETIKSYPDEMIVEIGGSKVLLTHYIRDYNTEREREIPTDINAVLQGHVHFANNSGGIVRTIRGAGIGMNSEEYGTAAYVILQENPDGGFSIEERIVRYDSKSSQHDIIESNMEDEEKEKMSSWIGGRSK